MLVREQASATTAFGIVPGILREAYQQYEMVSSTTAKVEILAVINRFLDCVRTKDKKTFYSCVIEPGLCMRFRNGAIKHQTIGEAIEALPIWNTDDLVHEHMFNVEVHVDNEFAMVWAPFVAFVNGELHLDGTNIFTMFKEEGKWLIAGINDVGRTH